MPSGAWPVPEFDERAEVSGFPKRPLLRSPRPPRPAWTRILISVAVEQFVSGIAADDFSRIAKMVSQIRLVAARNKAWR